CRSASEERPPAPCGSSHKGWSSACDRTDLRSTPRIARCEAGKPRCSPTRQTAERLDRLLHRLLAERPIGDVTADQQATLAFGFDGRLRDLRILVFAEIDDSHIRTFACEQNSERPSDTGIAAGDDGSLALQHARSEIERGLEHRRRIEFHLLTRLGLMLPGKRRRW